VRPETALIAGDLRLPRRTTVRHGGGDSTLAAGDADGLRVRRGASLRDNTRELLTIPT
jgi:hypothetical protein